VSFKPWNQGFIFLDFSTSCSSKDLCRQGYDAVLSCEWYPMFQKIVIHSDCLIPKMKAFWSLRCWKPPSQWYSVTSQTTDLHQHSSAVGTSNLTRSVSKIPAQYNSIIYSVTWWREQSVFETLGETQCGQQGCYMLWWEISLLSRVWDRNSSAGTWWCLAVRCWTFAALPEFQVLRAHSWPFTVFLCLCWNFLNHSNTQHEYEMELHLCKQFQTFCLFL
jgi:hypothetical protein